MLKKDLLMGANFGSRVAEEEGDELRSYFVETEQWRQLIAGDVDIVYGAKGAGKSALYSLLVGQQETLRLGRRIVFIPAENPRGTPAFRDLASDPPATEEQFRALWKLYFLTLLANYLRRHFEATKTSNPDAARVIRTLIENDLLASNQTLIGRINSVLDYIRHRMPSLETSVVDPGTGMTMTGKISFAEPNAEQRAAGVISADEMIGDLNAALQKTNITIWLVLDRLDVAFSDSSELEGNALRSLFRVYLDLISWSNISIKIFLRDDIWRKLLSTGFREASHITRSLIISWSEQSIVNLIVRRLLHNAEICKAFAIDREEALKDLKSQTDFFYRIFPSQIAVGQKQRNTLNWILSRAADGSKRTAPREVIHLLSATRDQQLKLYELGNAEPPAENLFDRGAIREALREVSKVRYEQTLCAENSALKPYLDQLDGQKTQQSPESLGRLWRCTLERASQLAEELAEAGFFERKGSRDKPSYVVPFLYRSALNLVQGTA